MRTHPIVGDSLIAALLGLFDLALLLFALGDNKTTAQFFLIALLDIAVVVPLVFRRKYPIVVAYLVLILGTLHTTWELGMSGIVAGAVSLYTLVVYTNRRQALYYLVANVVLGGLEIAFSTPREEYPVTIVVGLLVLAFCWVLGEFVGARRAYHKELEGRLHLLETERDQATRIAIGEERSRIARELHDVVAHAVSVMVVQADGASYAIASDTEQARLAVRTISTTGRQALAELRRLLTVLREDTNDPNGTSEPRIPQPDAQSLNELIDRITATGVKANLDITGELTDLPAGVSLGIYRIVQESLTNTLKHAGTKPRVDVAIRRGDDAVEIEIVDDGSGKARAIIPPPTGQITATMGAAYSAGLRPLPGGNGVIGMRERAHVLGGKLEVGSAPGGGWRVFAWLPIKSTH